MKNPFEGGFSLKQIVVLFILIVVIGGALADDPPAENDPADIAAAGTPATTTLVTDGGTTVQPTQTATPTMTTTTPTPTTTARPTPEPTPEPMSDYTMTDMRLLIESQGVSVPSAYRVGSGAELTHESGPTTQSELSRQMGTVAGGWAVYVSHHPEVTGDMEVTLVNEYGSTAGYYTVETADARAYNAGEITADEFAYRILASIETV